LHYYFQADAIALVKVLNIHQLLSIIHQCQRNYTMKITKITAYAIKADTTYRMVGQSKPTHQLPDSDYFQYPPYPQLYSHFLEALIVRVETDEGLIGWGEGQVPVGPEVLQKIVERVIGPVILGRDPLETNVRYAEMFDTLRVRGQTSGYQVDAIAAIDTALWDIRGQAEGRSISDLLGGRFRDRLPMYVSGLRAATREARAEEAAEWTRQGMGVKNFIGFGYAADAAELTAIRQAVGDEARLFTDGLWKYSYPEAVRIGRILEAHDLVFFEAPLLPEDIEGHSKLAHDLDIAIAVGEPLRTRFEFLNWFKAKAIDICQPDLMRNGISETYKIALLAEAYNIPVALHVGAVTAIGMAATWQTAAALPNFYMQEFQPLMFNAFNPWLQEPLRHENGQLIVPTGPGLGIALDQARFARDVDSEVTISL
jgi:L-alanine-DL-glutamate epimerase-like enolase superfamily enzyme